MRRLTKLVILAGGTALAGWTAWGVYATRSAESVPYERVRTIDGVEIRRYPRLVLAETTAADQLTAFRRLFRYISGANAGEASIPMTTPVETRGASISMTAPVRSEPTDDDGVRMAFFLPPSYDVDTAPEPTASTVELTAEPSKTVAVKQFSWYAPQRRVERQERALRRTLERAQVDVVGDPSLLRYNDPWTPPFLRRNEIAIEIASEE
ncbi:heme-binding protein [Halobellus sp. Atlit-31R]|nr:heme-binding protein [Halobellus sp. Atlit-31R]